MSSSAGCGPVSRSRASSVGLVRQDLLAADAVDGAVARGRDQPADRVGRFPVAWPPFGGDRRTPPAAASSARSMSPRMPDQGGQHAAPLIAEDGVKRHRSAPPGWAGPRSRCRVWSAPSSSPALASAPSRSPASIRIRPARYSLLSMNGPSVSSTGPGSLRSVVADSSACSRIQPVTSGRSSRAARVTWHRARGPVGVLRRSVDQQRVLHESSSHGPAPALSMRRTASPWTDSDRRLIFPAMVSARRPAVRHCCRSARPGGRGAGGADDEHPIPVHRDRGPAALGAGPDLDRVLHGGARLAGRGHRPAPDAARTCTPISRPCSGPSTPTASPSRPGSSRPPRSVTASGGGGSSSSAWRCSRCPRPRARWLPMRPR